MSSGPQCEATERAVEAFVAGRLSAQETSAVRRHRAVCAPCDALWRQQVGAAAGVQSKLRHAREKEERAARRSAHRRKALEASAERTDHGGAGRKQRGWQLRLLLLPAFAIVLMAVIHPLGRSRRASLEVLAGEVQLTSNRYGIDDPPVPLVRGDQCATGSEGRARIDGADGRVELGGDTFLVVEDEMSLRLRLEVGSLAIEGSASVTTRFGIVEIERGRAAVRAGANGLELTAERGRVVATNGEGARQLLPGSSAFLGHPR